MCLPPLDHHLEGLLARAEGGDNFQLTMSPEPSLNNSSEWVRLYAKQLKIMTWWWELSKVPGQTDVQEFVRQVWVSCQLPKVSSHAQGVTNDYLALLAPHSLECEQFLPLSDVKLGGQDYYMRQPQKTLASAKALAY